MKDGVVKAFIIMFNAHKGQEDRGGKPYWLHPLYVALHCSTRNQVITALLHDVVEDTDVELSDLSGFNEECQRAVKLLTHKAGVDYMEYIKAVACDPLAKAVKVQDLKHNMQLTRLKMVTASDIERRGKYKKALEYLTEA